MKRGIVKILPIFLALLGALVLAIPVLASVEQPTTLEIQEIEAYENYHEEDAQLYIATYYIDFENTPGEDVDELFLFQLLDDGGDALVTKTAYPFHDDGYGLGVVAFYLDAGDAPTWESEVSVKVVGNPMVEWEGGIPNNSSDVIAWNTGTMEEIEEMVSAKVLELAAELEEAWGVDMVTTSGGVTTLTDDGATYFVNVVPYLGIEAPAVFGQYIFGPDYPIDAKPPSDNYADWLATSIDDTIFDLGPVERAHHISAGSLGTGIYYGFVIFLFVLLISKGKLNKGTMLLFWPFVVAGAFFGVPLQVTIIAGFLCLISTVWIFYKGTT